MALWPARCGRERCAKGRACVVPSPSRLSVLSRPTASPSSIPLRSSVARRWRTTRPCPTLAQHIRALLLHVTQRNTVREGLRQALADLVTPGGPLSARLKTTPPETCASSGGQAPIVVGTSLSSPVEAELGCCRRCLPINPVPHQHREQGVTDRPPASAPAASPSTERTSLRRHP